MQSRDQPYRRGRQLAGLLCRRPLPDANHPRRTSADCCGQRDGRVDEQRALAHRLAQRGERVRLSREGHAQNCRRDTPGGRSVLIALEVAVGNDLARAFGGVVRARNLARANHDRDPRRQAHHQTETERARCTDYRNSGRADWLNGVRRRHSRACASTATSRRGYRASICRRPYLSSNASTTADTALASVIGVVVADSVFPLALNLIVGVCNRFLYHWLSVPSPGRRYILSPSSTNQTGREVSRPLRLPTVV